MKAPAVLLFRSGLVAGLWLALPAPARAADPFADPPPPALGILSDAPGSQRIVFGPYPAADQFRLWSASDLGLGTPWSLDLSGSFSNLTWTGPIGPGASFRRLEVTPLSSNAVLTATVLNRLAYGPTPDLLDRLASIGPDAYIAEQLAPETINERATAAHATIASIESRFGTPTNYIVSSAQVATGPGTAGLTDLQAWLALRAVFADRQLLEVLSQFWENHFVTYAAKSANFFVGAQFRDAYPQRAAAEWEWREATGWRNAMLRTNWTFHDVLRVSAESPAMITYLDTATSRGNPPNIP